ncbi:MAG: CRISPR-associated endonuclease Cas1, partial [candidate division KSB1 bacterium]|nr:CRISPR-associated endonuclease Cas1 [candidate division KSB1 bacterium]
QLQQGTMQLVLNTFGAYLSKSGDCFEVKIDDQKQVVSAKKVQSILITTGCAFWWQSPRVTLRQLKNEIALNQMNLAQLLFKGARNGKK